MTDITAMYVIPASVLDWVYSGSDEKLKENEDKPAAEDELDGRGQESGDDVPVAEPSSVVDNPMQRADIVREKSPLPSVLSPPEIASKTPIKIEDFVQKLPKKIRARAKRLLQNMEDTPIFISSDYKLYIDGLEKEHNDPVTLVKQVLQPSVAPRRPRGYDAFVAALNANGLRQFLYAPAVSPSNVVGKSALGGKGTLKEKPIKWYKIGLL